MRANRQTIQRTSAHSLQSRLVLSYLVVILGTVLVLIFVASLAAQNYFHSVQTQQVQAQAQYYAHVIISHYQHSGSDWNNSQPATLIPENPDANSVEIVTNSQGAPVFCNQPQTGAGSTANTCTTSSSSGTTINDNTIRQIINQTLNANGPQSGDIALQSSNQNTQSSVYASVPLQFGAGGPTIGVLFLTQPQLTDETLFLNQIRVTFILAGLGVAAIATIIAYLLINGIVKPLNALTVAAERMKRGQYAVRAPVPSVHDELGQLALTFNEMADTIESDVNELRQQDQMRRDLIANIAHDLATPLTAIQGLSEALADDVISDREVRQETSLRIGREVQRLRRMVAEVRQMTQMEAGQIQMDLEPLDLHSQVDETVAVIAPECEQMGIKLENAIATTTPLVLADSDRITQVLLNLLDNARRHTRSGGTIRVTATPRRGSVQVSVQDTGVGIAADDLPHIFERFYRADRSRTTQTGGGSGLGLAIVKAIINAHGGQVQADSQPGQGTTISFTLPTVKTSSLAHTTAPVRP